MPSTTQQEWLNQNAQRAYPFKEDTQRVPTDVYGNLLADTALPNYVLVDFVFTLPSTGSIGLYLSSLGLVGTLLTLVFSEDATNTPVCTVSVNTATHVVNQGYNLVGMDQWSDARGRIVLGTLDRLSDDLADGIYTFTPDQTAMETCTVRPAIRGVRSLQVVDGANVSDPISGRVQLVAGDNIALYYEAATNAIWISATPNSAYAEPCTCESTMATNVVRTINGIPVQDLQLKSNSECLDISASAGVITFTDNCSKPCCGCEELAFLTTAVRTLQASLDQLDALSQQLTARVDAFIQNYILTM